MWSSRILAAAAANRDRFAIALGELELDDPFTAVILYDGSLPQPWARIDIQREIKSIHVAPLDADGREFNFAALSNEGDFYYLSEEIVREKIPGAGVLSDDAVGKGALSDLGYDGVSFLAVGQQSQFYRRVGNDDWRFDPPLTGPDPGFRGVWFGSVAALSPSDIYLSGSDRPEREPYDVTREPEFSPGMSVDELVALIRRGRTRSGHIGAQGPEPRVYHFNGTTWRRLELPTSCRITDIFVESETRIWMVGYSGVILLGNADHGFRDVSFHGDTETLVSITKFRDQMIVASSHGLHSFDGHVLSRIRPRIDPAVDNAVPSPVRVQAVDDVLFYFDYGNGVYRWDGETWTAVPIPPALLVRDFRGLPSRE